MQPRYLWGSSFLRPVIYDNGELRKLYLFSRQASTLTTNRGYAVRAPSDVQFL